MADPDHFEVEEKVLLDSPIRAAVDRVDKDARRGSHQSQGRSFQANSDARLLKRNSKFEPEDRLKLETLQNVISPDIIDIAVDNLDSPHEVKPSSKPAINSPASLAKQAAPFLKARNKKSGGYRGRKVF